MTPEIQHLNNKFFMIVDGMESHLEYEMHGEKTVVFYHTYVPETLRGKGLARQIIREGLDWAKQNNYRIIPSCSAVRTFILRNPEYTTAL
ncbi:MAG: N-acetyltransferase [Bacteroidales bacterium]|nr:N-acetyltransferase [Bacteroidales bacterium]